MAIKRRQYTVIVGRQQTLEIAQGEDCEYDFTFIEPPDAPNAGQPVDLTGIAAGLLTVKDASGIEMFSRNYLTAGGVAGTLSFVLGQTDTRTQAVQLYTVDVTWTDGSGHKEQLLVASPFILDLGVSQPGDAVTSPPAIPVVYGLRWLGTWSGATAYLVNDAVTYPDPNGGGSALSSFRCLVPNTNVPPLDNLGALSVDWAYVAERGAKGNDGSSGTSLVSTLKKTANYNAAAFDLVRCDPTGGGFTVTLPASPAKDVQIAVANQSASNNVITIAASGGNTVAGAASMVLDVARGSFILQYDGVSDWMVL